MATFGLAADAPTSQPAAVILPAADAQLQGAVMKLKYAKQVEITYWTDPKATAEWSVKVPQPGKYEIALIMASENEQGGKFVVSVAGQDLSAKTHPTGGWHHYMTLPIGSATFKETTATLKITPSGPIRGSLMNLRAVRLTPIP